jgi:hypothetical protein
VGQLHPRPFGGQLYVDLLLDAGARFHRLDQADEVAVLRHLHRAVVGQVGARVGFGGMPETVSPVDAPLVAAGLPGQFGILLELVLLAQEPKADEARAHVGQQHQLDTVVVQPAGVGPAVVVDPLHHFPLAK